uniref:Ovule protein n=1 Tax=Heterorhabditis bacteriophora TaxID=37862 RepID=A0A1I7XAR2_HETBA
MIDVNNLLDFECVAFNIAFTLQYFLSHIFRYFSFGNFASETQEMQTEAKVTSMILRRACSDKQQFMRCILL